MSAATELRRRCVSTQVKLSNESVCMLLHGYYPSDPRVRRAARTLVDSTGARVDVVCLRREGEPAREVVDGVGVVRLPFGRRRGNRLVYLIDYTLSLLAMALCLLPLHARARYDVVQVHTPPDLLVLAALSLKMSGARIVVDFHDLMPELYRSRFSLAGGSIVARCLQLGERIATTIADHAITANELFRERLVERGAPESKVSVVPNAPDPALFRSVAVPGETHTAERFIVLNTGSMIRRYGLDIAVSAMAVLRGRIPGIELWLYGEGDEFSSLAELSRELGVEDMVVFGGHVDQAEIPGLITAADLGIVPSRLDAHMEIAFPTKSLEYAVLGLPIVATRTRSLEVVFSDDSVRYCDPCPISLAAGIEWAYGHRSEARLMAEEAAIAAKMVSWEAAAPSYLRSMGVRSTGSGIELP